MSLTAIIFITIFGIGVIATFHNPVFGVLLYVFEWHNHPPYMWWGTALPDIRYSFIIAIITLISLIINQGKLKKIPIIKSGPFIWLIVFSLWMYIVSYGWALVPDVSRAKAYDFFKYSVFYFLIIQIIREEKHYHWFIWTLMIGVANFGRIAYQSGSNRYLGVMAPNSVGENAISAHVASTLPFFGTRFMLSSRFLKVLILIAVPFLINLIILANSRGAFVALIMMGLIALILFPSKEKLKIILVLIVGAMMVVGLANNQFWERQKTTLNPHEESSAESRFLLWQGAWNVVKDYPLGTGYRGFEQLVFDYVPELVPKMEEGGAKTVHNTFLLAGTDWGFPGLIIFLAFLSHTFLILHKLKIILRRYPSLNRKFYYEILSLQLALLGLLTAGIFSNRLYSEVLYWYGALSMVLFNIINSAILKQNQVAI